MKFFTVMLGATALTVLAVTAIARIPVPQNPIEVQAAEDRFDRAWVDTMGPVALKKADLERQLAVAEPKPVATERIVLEEQPPLSLIPPVISTKLKEKERKESRERKPKDVCARHGLRKVTIGKRWRCRR